jgi:hypothetical protein
MLILAGPILILACFAVKMSGHKNCAPFWPVCKPCFQPPVKPGKIVT